MSRSVDLFISSSLPLDELAEVLRRRSSAQLIPTTDPDRWRYIDGPVIAELFEHPYLDDGDLWLSRYRYVLSARMGSGVGPLDSVEVRSLRHLSQLLHDPESFPVLLVLDLQYRLGPQPPDDVPSSDEPLPPDEFLPPDDLLPSDEFLPPDDLPPSDEPLPPDDLVPSDEPLSPDDLPPVDEPLPPAGRGEDGEQVVVGAAIGRDRRRKR
jgi:hypothetical protein